MTTRAQTTSTRRSRARWRWAAPVGAAAVIAAGTLAVNSVAQADPGLPARSAEQLVTDVLTAKVDGLSGTVSETANLGLPSLAGIGGGSDLQSLVTGTHTARVWAAGDDRQRISVPDGANETDVIRSGTTTWIWNSKERTATKFTGSDHAKAGHGGHRSERSGTPMTPQQAAQRLLGEVGKTSTVSTARNSTVAGRSAYELVVTPKQAGSKVARIELAIDGTTHVPLRLEVFAVGTTKPAIEVGFTDVDFAVPPADVFAFTPPADAKVTDRSGARSHDPNHKPNGTPTKKGGSHPSGDRPTTVGTGWTSVAVMKVPSGSTSGQDQQSLSKIVNQLPEVSGSWGRGHLFDGPLFTAVITDDGRVAVGAVQPDVLYRALG